MSNFPFSIHDLVGKRCLICRAIIVIPDVPINGFHRMDEFTRRLTDHPFNCEPLPRLLHHFRFITPSSLHYVHVDLFSQYPISEFRWETSLFQLVRTCALHFFGLLSCLTKA